MKKVLFTIVLMLLPMLASAAAVKIKGIYYNLDNETKTAQVTANPDGYKDDVTIPGTASYDGTTYDVTSIGTEAFKLCMGLKSITIPSSVTKIGRGAFKRCISLTSITIPNSVTIIRSEAFYECSGLTSVTIGNGVKEIDMDTFGYCSSLTSITIPNSVTSIDSEAFCGCTSLTSVIIQGDVTEIGWMAFSECSSLSDVYCHAKSVPSTDKDAFSDSNIANATLHVPSESTDAYSAAGPWNQFKEIVALESAQTVVVKGVYYKLYSEVMEAEVTENPDKYQGHVSIPDAINYNGRTYSVTSIGDYVFSNSGLTSVTIGNKVITIGEGAFCITGAMTSVTIGSSVTSIGKYAFAYSGLTSVTIPGSVTTIEEMAFDYCINMTSVTIGSGVTSIGKYAFGDCRSMTDMICHAENVPTTDSKAFDESNANAILHVPAVSTDAYSATEPWNGFKEIVALEDLNGDGVVDAKDIVALVRRIAEGDFSATGVLSDNGSAAGDINSDGVVNAADVVMLANIIMGK